MRQNCFKHLILNYLDNTERIGLTDVIVQFYCLASIFSLLSSASTALRDLFAFSSSSLTYLREMIEQCLQASVSCSLCMLFFSSFFAVSILTFIDRTIKTITVIKTERKNNKSKHRVDFLHCTMRCGYTIKANTLRSLTRSNWCALWFHATFQLTYCV